MSYSDNIIINPQEHRRNKAVELAKRKAERKRKIQSCAALISDEDLAPGRIVKKYLIKRALVKGDPNVLLSAGQEVKLQVDVTYVEPDVGYHYEHQEITKICGKSI